MPEPIDVRCQGALVRVIDSPFVAGWTHGTTMPLDIILSGSKYFLNQRGNFRVGDTIELLRYALDPINERNMKNPDQVLLEIAWVYVTKVTSQEVALYLVEPIRDVALAQSRGSPEGENRKWATTLGTARRLGISIKGKTKEEIESEIEAREAA